MTELAPRDLAVGALAVTGLLIMVAVRRRLAWRGEEMARACHEIRGPLGAARLAVALAARRGSLSPEQLRALDLELERAALALSDLDRARAGRSAIAPSLQQEFSVEALLADSVAAWQASAEMRGVQLRLSWTGPEATTCGERARLAQAVGNLIANALEHGAGPVEVRGSAEGGDVRIEVLDAGPGLKAPVAELVRRADPADGVSSKLRRGPIDRGHGLVIAAQVAIAHGGRLASGPTDGGARLVLTLPHRPAPPTSRLPGY